MKAVWKVTDEGDNQMMSPDTSFKQIPAIRRLLPPRARHLKLIWVNAAAIGAASFSTTDRTVCVFMVGRCL